GQHILSHLRQRVCRGLQQRLNALDWPSEPDFSYVGPLGHAMISPLLCYPYCPVCALSCCNQFSATISSPGCPAAPSRSIRNRKLPRPTQKDGTGPARERRATENRIRCCPTEKVRPAGISAATISV